MVSGITGLSEEVDSPRALRRDTNVSWDNICLQIGCSHFLMFFHLVVCITVCWFGCQNVLNLSKVCAFSEKVVDSLERKRGRSFSRRD